MTAEDELWVFGYGSLMWRPGFYFDEQVPGLLKGAHRSMCVYSIHHRGTEDRPGLVLGLDRGGACRGVAFRVRPGHEDDTMVYLRKREQTTFVYRETFRPVQLLDGSTRRIHAVCYLVDRQHTQYAGRLSLEDQTGIVAASRGQSGANTEYVLNTVRHLEDAGVHDPMLAGLAARLLR
ncbi:gamma-glutamylcyclotransferase [Methyloligella sp. 2.7D]|uniref:gamma-glutamylcyclotransferase n=1 Tax=unclassified Methyloligella TaxID=2625955 RepID=UPI00157CC0B0|nr:gamma-glutamylcyclotransferase [Methyloligella sp. GL2]QKP76466.1 gamma-glutamylcyclotransferase [Methyloligella sp. GL2]